MILPNLFSNIAGEYDKTFHTVKPANTDKGIL